MSLRRFFPSTIRQAGGVHPYDLVLAKATSLGYTLPSSTQQTKDRNKITYLIDNDLWHFDLFYYGKTEAGLLDFSTINWADPDNFQLNSVNPPTLIAGSGWKGNGTNQFWRTGYQTNTHRVNVGPLQAVGGSKAFGIPSTFSVHHINYSARTTLAAQSLFITNPSSGTVLTRFYQNTSISILQTEMNNHFLARKRLSGIDPFNSHFYVDAILKQQIQTTTVINNDLEIVLLADNFNGTISTYSPYGLEYMFLGNGEKAAGKETILYQIMNETYTP